MESLRSLDHTAVKRPSATHHVKRGRLALMVKEDGAPVTKRGPYGVRHGAEEILLLDHKVKDADLARKGDRIRVRKIYR